MRDVDEEKRTRRRIEARHMGKRTESVSSSVKGATTKNWQQQDEVAKSDRILNSLIEEVRHRSKPFVRLNEQKENDEEESEGEGGGKKHKKKKRQKEKEHKSKKKSHRSAKDQEGKHAKKRRKRHYQSEEEEEAEKGRARSDQKPKVGIDVAKKRRNGTAGDAGERPFGAGFQFFGQHKERAGLNGHHFGCANSESDSDEQSDTSFERKPTLANILSSAPLSFPWLTALGKTKQSEEKEGGKTERSEKDTKKEQLANDEKGNAEHLQKDSKEQNAANSEKGLEKRVEERKNEEKQKMGEEEEAAKKSAKRHDHSRNLKSHRRCHSPKRRPSPRQKRSNRSRSRTYSTSPERVLHTEKGAYRCHRPSTSKSPSPLPPFSRQRALETRRRLIEESWHRRIEHSVRPCEVTENKRWDVRGGADGSASGERECTDENGRIDKQKLLEIATRNATRLAMEGKLPKGAELVETIKNKSVGQLVDLCKKLQSDPSLALKRHGDASSNSESDEERRYERTYEKWLQKEQRREDREFRNRAVRPAGEPARLSRREQREIVRHEENTLRLTFPVSSGVQHRVKANAPISAECSAGPLVRLGDIGPLTTALAKVRTNIPAAYKPLSKPLPLSQPSSTLSSNFQSTSQAPIGPQQPNCQLKKPLYPQFVPSKTLDCVNQNAYEIALAASARKDEAEKRDETARTEPFATTSDQFIGPVIPNPAVDSVLTASLLLNSVDGTSAAPSPICPSSSTANQTATLKTAFSSSWDRPGHIAARESLLKKIAEQSRKAEHEITAPKGTEVPETQSPGHQTAKGVPMTADAAHTQQSSPHATPVPPICSVPSTDVASFISSSSPPQLFATTPFSLASTAPQSSDSVSVSTTTVQQQQQAQVAPGRSGTTASETYANADGQFKKPALPTNRQTFVPSDFGTPMLLPTTKKPTQTDAMPPQRTTTNDEQSNELTEEIAGQGTNFLDRFHTFVEAQVARQKEESALQATIVSTSLQQKQVPAPKDEQLATFSAGPFFARPVSAMSSSLVSSRPDPLGLTRPQKSIQELAAERLRYSRRLQRDPNDYEARRALAQVDKQMSSWAQDSSLPGEFTGHTGARVLSEKELEPSDPRFHAWAKKDQFRTAPEINSGIGMRLLQRMGWQPGQGLGRDRAGQLEPLALDVKADRKGLFSCLERAPTRESVLDAAGKNPISVLMEQCARNRWRNPEFSCAESGPQNNRRYHWKAVLNGVEYAPSLPSSNKKAGKAQVCMVILEALGMS